MLFKPVLLLAAAEAVSAHFGLTAPSWRADTLANEDKYSQWDYPCASFALSPRLRLILAY